MIRQRAKKKRQRPKTIIVANRKLFLCWFSIVFAIFITQHTVDLTYEPIIRHSWRLSRQLLCKRHFFSLWRRVSFSTWIICIRFGVFIFVRKATWGWACDSDAPQYETMNRQQIWIRIKKQLKGIFFAHSHSEFRHIFICTHETSTKTNNNKRSQRTFTVWDRKKIKR